jgi:hypothetical protein
MKPRKVQWNFPFPQWIVPAALLARASSPSLQPAFLPRPLPPQACTFFGGTPSVLRLQLGGLKSKDSPVQEAASTFPDKVQHEFRRIGRSAVDGARLNCRATLVPSISGLWWTQVLPTCIDPFLSLITAWGPVWRATPGQQVPLVHENWRGWVQVQVHVNGKKNLLHLQAAARAAGG